MISIIVPVYNIEPYLRKCLDSILAQTYQALEILVVDDGSTDGSGKICDDYAKENDRIKVFHTENMGLSCARNLGLDNAKGEWIGFVDSDDWIEPDMNEALLNRAEETGADVVECGIFQEYTTRTIEKKGIVSSISGVVAVEALIRGDFHTQVWNKLWKSIVFKKTRFPAGRDYEDIATTHRLIKNAVLSGVPHSYYHYIQRNSAISQNHRIKNLRDNWLAHKERYEDLKDGANKETIEELLKFCAYSISRVWIWYLKSEDDSDLIEDISAFTHKKFSLFGSKEWPIKLRICIFLSRFNNQISFTIAFAGNQLYRLIKPKYYV